MDSGRAPDSLSRFRIIAVCRSDGDECVFRMGWLLTFVFRTASEIGEMYIVHDMPDSFGHLITSLWTRSVPRSFACRR